MNYYDADGSILQISLDLDGESWYVYSAKNPKTIAIIEGIPPCKTQEEAQKKLNEYAKEHSLKPCSI